ncbi:MAG: isoprenylcysteine carboxylmethyltransferase family protein [Verrucomicrobiota bacterium]
MTDARSSNTFAGRGGWWVVGQSVLMLAAIGLAVMFSGNGTNLAIIIAGSVLFANGGYFGIAGVIVLGKNRTPFPQPREGSKLIQHGIYSRIRHPLYTSVMMASLGWALIWQSAASFIAALTLIPFLHAKARREEKSLHQTFPSYADYARRVPRFLPHLSRKVNLVCNF